MFGRCNWTDMQAATERQSYIDFGKQGPLGNNKKEGLDDAPGKSFPCFAVI